METVIRCPMPRCDHRIRSGPQAAEAMTSHLVDGHDLPEVSAIYQAHLLLPVTVPRAA